jgi:hypothetical protein
MGICNNDRQRRCCAVPPVDQRRTGTPGRHAEIPEGSASVSPAALREGQVKPAQRTSIARRRLHAADANGLARVPSDPDADIQWAMVSSAGRCAGPVLGNRGDVDGKPGQGVSIARRRLLTEGRCPSCGRFRRPGAGIIEGWSRRPSSLPVQFVAATSSGRRSSQPSVPLLARGRMASWRPRTPLPIGIAIHHGRAPTSLPRSRRRMARADSRSSVASFVHFRTPSWLRMSVVLEISRRGRPMSTYCGKSPPPVAFVRWRLPSHHEAFRRSAGVSMAAGACGFR